MSTPVNANPLAVVNGLTDYYTRTPRTPITLQEVLSKRLIDISKVVRAEPVVTICNSIFARQGDFSLIMGQRKAGKTTISQFVIATALMERIPTDVDTLGIRSRYCEGKDVIYIDTEGSEEDTADFIKGVLNIIDKSQAPLNLHVFRFREYSQDECREAVEHLFNYFDNSHLWLIDGIADLVKSPNQEQESNEVVRFLIKYAGKLKTCMILIIHENPGDGNKKARGHLGSELERKAGGGVGVVKDNSTKPTRHLIQSRFFRKCADLEDIAFEFDLETHRPTTISLSADEREALRSKDFNKVKELIKIRETCYKGIDHRTEKELKTSLRFNLGPW